jgi:hypothetical protein
MNDLNCWIDKAGNVRPIRAGTHAIEQRNDDVIRVSTPERRRTWLGIEVLPAATPAAKLACKRLIREVRRQRFDIIAEFLDGRPAIEVLRSDRPTELNRALG